MASNEDQYYLKGYTDFIAPTGYYRFKDFQVLIQNFLSDATYRSGHNKSDNENIDLAVRRMPVNGIGRIRSKTTQLLQGVDNCGTLHQFFCNTDEMSEIIDAELERVEEEQENTIHNKKAKLSARNSNDVLNEVLVYLTKSLTDKQRVITNISENDANNDTTLSLEFRKLAIKVAKMRWTSVGIDPCLNKQNLQKNENKSLTAEDNEIANMLKYNIFHHNEMQDHRSLALKIDLYDELRERRFVQPSGVGYAMAEPIMPETEYLHLNTLNQWHYKAIFISVPVLDNVLRGGGKLNLVGPEREAWSIKSKNVKVIGIDTAMKPIGIGLYTWILSHLAYPLLWVIDHYLVRELGSEESKKQAFVRSAGLVDMTDNANKIVFVVSPKDASQLKLAGHKFSVACVDEKGSFEDCISEYDMDMPICAMIDACMQYSGSLKAAFSEYTSTYFPNGIDWLEISSITNTLIVRWHQKIETNLGESDKDCYSVGAPKKVLSYMDLKPADEISNESYPYYGGLSAVNSLDQRFVNLEKAKQCSLIFLGNWNTATELAIFTQYAIYVTQNAKDPKEVETRFEDGGHDRLIRASWLRCAFEHFKRVLGVRDVIAFPKLGPNAKRYWSKLIGIDGEPKGSCVSWFAKYVVSDNVTWNWKANFYSDSRECALTGIRTLSYWWRSIENTELSSFKAKNNLKSSEYYFKLTNDSSDRYIQKDQEYAYRLEKVLMRCDMQHWQHLKGNMAYRLNATMEEDKNVPWCVDSTFPGKLAIELGWKRFVYSSPMICEVWGWGVGVESRDEEFGASKTLLLPIEMYSYAVKDADYLNNFFYRKTISGDINNLEYHCIGWQKELHYRLNRRLRYH